MKNIASKRLSHAYQRAFNKTLGRAFRVKTKKATAARQRKQESEKRGRRIEFLNRVRQWPDQPLPMFKAKKVRYEFSERGLGLAYGGIGAIHTMVQALGLPGEINRSLKVLLVHVPYWESDHVLNIAYNTLCGGTCLEDLETLRNDEAYVMALGAARTPDPTTAGDFCRRLDEQGIRSLMNAFNRIRLKVWSQQPKSFFEEAILEADGTIVETDGECKRGMDFSYNGRWGYHPLMVSLANTGEPLFLLNRSGHRPSHEGAAGYFDEAIQLCRKAGFRRITLRGDTDFSQTEHLDRWDEDRVGFLFGYDAKKNLVDLADSLPKSAWSRLNRKPRYVVQTTERARPINVKERVVKQRQFKNIKLLSEDVAEFDYSPSKCRNKYRVIVVRKSLRVLKGQQTLQPEQRYFFYITNDRRRSARSLVFKANDRCDQENLIEQLKNGTRSLRAPLDNLLSNWAYMVIASLAWSLKAWAALLLPEGGRGSDKRGAEKLATLRMGFKKFVQEFIRLPALLVRTGRQIVYRLLTWNRHQHVFLRLVDVLERPLRC